MVQMLNFAISFKPKKWNKIFQKKIKKLIDWKFEKQIAKNGQFSYDEFSHFLH